MKFKLALAQVESKRSAGKNLAAAAKIIEKAKQKGAQLLVFPELFMSSLVDCVQIRFFIAYCIVIFSLNFLSYMNAKGYFIFLILIFIASSIHTSNWFYILLMLVVFVDKISRKKFYFLFFSILILLTFSISFGKGVLFSIISNFSNARQMFYLTSNNLVTFSELIIYGITISVFVLFSAYMKFDFLKNKESIQFKKLSSFFSIVLCFNLCTISILPMMTFSNYFLRLQRPVWILMYFEFSYYLLHVKKRVFIKELSIVLLSFFGFFILLDYYFPLVLPSYFSGNN